MCLRDYAILSVDADNAKAFELDMCIASAIRKFNFYGYITESCCCGHYEKKIAIRFSDPKAVSMFAGEIRITESNKAVVHMTQEELIHNLDFAAKNPIRGSSKTIHLMNLTPRFYLTIRDVS